MAAPAADDFFALLGEPRRPLLDPERVKDTFHRLSREQHPDTAASVTTPAAADPHTDNFARLNRAQAALRDPRLRLRHLLDLEYPGTVAGGPTNVPATLADLFAPVSTLAREADELLARKAAASSALARALLARQGLALHERAAEILSRLDALQADADEDLARLDTAWHEAPRPTDSAARLLDLYGRFAYLGRWTEQMRERVFQLGS